MSAPTNVNWNAHTMFSSPGPNRTNTAATIVAVQGLTPARRMTTRNNAAVVRCAMTTTL